MVRKCAEDNFFYGKEDGTGSETGENGDTGGTIRHAEEISRKGQEDLKKMGKVIHLCATVYSVAEASVRTGGDH